ncbi:uncharacterized protein N7496_004111 [Penicillium cataractarum]|uniref:Nitrogen regulatory protein areA GATA-like domain-containing protein n=1 Tax=Penicillium cataractarum TaxID=2100454 RepID=A0A9W9VGU6_9EURO|nr:uncharacterized protein N7496_004111 [Penicillium cataractarum]KAJ5381683.1 hypothetical protein N7496_004111 [Penicillium cataractarum]
MDSKVREELARLSIAEMIEMLENSNMDMIPGLWKVYHYALPATETNQRLENLFWRVWSNQTLQNRVNKEVLMRLVWSIDTPAGISQDPELMGWQPPIFEQRAFEADVRTDWDLADALWEEEMFAGQSSLHSPEGTEPEETESSESFEETDLPGFANERGMMERNGRAAGAHRQALIPNAYARFAQILAAKMEKKKQARTRVTAMDAALATFSGILPLSLLRAQSPAPLQHSTVQSVISDTCARFVEMMAEKTGDKKVDAGVESSSSPSLISSHVSSYRPSPPIPSPSASFIPSLNLSPDLSSRGSSSPSDSPSPGRSPYHPPSRSLNSSPDPYPPPSPASSADFSLRSSRSPSPESASPSNPPATRPQSPDSDEEGGVSLEGYNSSGDP